MENPGRESNYSFESAILHLPDQPEVCLKLSYGADDADENEFGRTWFYLRRRAFILYDSAYNMIGANPTKL